MKECQAGSEMSLDSRFVSGFPLVNRIKERLRVDRLLQRVLSSMTVLLRAIILNNRQPVAISGMRGGFLA
jgi:hypothetical protein